MTIHQDKFDRGQKERFWGALSGTTTLGSCYHGSHDSARVSNRRSASRGLGLSLGSPGCPGTRGPPPEGLGARVLPPAGTGAGSVTLVHTVHLTLVRIAHLTLVRIDRN